MEPGLIVAISVVKLGGVEPAVSVSNCNEFEVAPPEEAVCTEITDIPAVAISLAGTLAVSLVPSTNWVTRALDPHRTLEVAVKPEPFAVRVKVEPPAVVIAGERLMSTGTGLLIVYAADATALGV